MTFIPTTFINELLQSTAMHQVFEDHGWNVDIIRDDSDRRGYKSISILERMVNKSPLERTAIRVASAVAAVVDEFRYQDLFARQVVDTFYDFVERFRFSPLTQEDPLNGCAHVLYAYGKEEAEVTALIEILEMTHNNRVRVIAFAKRRTDLNGTVPYFKLRTFEGINCKAEASKYAHTLR